MSGYSPLAMVGFEVMFRPWLLRRIRLRIAGWPPRVASDVPLLVAANHTSWWDPFVLREVQRVLRPGAPIYTLMLESELRQRPFLRRIGVTGIDPSSVASLRGAIRTLRKAVDEHPDATILYFPQGRIWPTHRRPLGFQRGMELFVRELQPIITLPAALHVEPLNRVAPTVFVKLGDPWAPAEPAPSAQETEARVEVDLDLIREHLARCGEASAESWGVSRLSLEQGRDWPSETTAHR